MSESPESSVEGAPLDSTTRHNLVMESMFSAFNGIYMGPAIMAAPVIAVVGVGAGALELTVLVCAFPVGAFLGPFWANLGRHWGMKRLVTHMAVLANLPLFFMHWVSDPVAFTVLVTISQLLNSAMRMGQSSLYGVLYPPAIRGRVLGRLTFWTYVTMVPSVLIAGQLLNKSHEMYRVIFPLAGLCGLIGCALYHQLRVPAGADRVGGSVRGIVARFREIEDVFVRDRVFFRLQAIFFLCGSSFFLTTHVVLILVRERFPFTPFELALWLTVTPQLLLAITSPVWGRILDRVGMARCRLAIAAMFAAYLGCYYVGIVTTTAWLIVAGSALLGIGNGGGQVTWALASVHFAPTPRQVPVYNGIHFVLNGVRGLVMPWTGAVLLVLLGTGAVLAGLLAVLLSVPVNLRLMRGDETPSPPDPPDEPRRPRSGPTATEFVQSGR